MSQETEALARRVADVQKLPVEQAIHLALEKEARNEGVIPEPPRPRDQSTAGVAARRARTDSFVACLAAMPVLDPRSAREIVDDLNAL